ncbi:MAG: carboxypeptidase-like regulatory domain-containing protein, partial [Salibacteraceae bacterium]
MSTLSQIILALTFCALLFSTQLGAQSISGRVVDPTGEAIPFANIALYSADSTLQGGSTSDANGKFSIESKPGRYYLEISFLSYQTKLTELLSVDRAPHELNPIVLNENSQMLDEVVIEAKRSQMEFKLDKRVFNVGQDLSNAGSNASEVLSNVPSVDVDIEGNVSLRG